MLKPDKVMDFAELESHVYLIPSKLIKNNDDMRNWERSETYYDYLGFIYTLNDAVRGKTNEEGSADPSPEVQKLVKLLETIESWIYDIPYDVEDEDWNKTAFREWYAMLRDGAIKLLQDVVPEIYYRAVPEIMVYLIEGFGNSSRCDYGTGHELSFLMLLCSLFKIGFLGPGDEPATVCCIFLKYLDIVRLLQQTYKMDSIGSFGVWSVDDYQFVPFAFGSSQLIGNSALDPSSYLKKSIVKENASRYMFFGCIDYINKIKKGDFAEHSNQLWSISGVSSWLKLNSGLIRMYQADIMLQFSLVKSVYFGSIFTLNAVESGSSIRRPRLSIANLMKQPTTVEFSSDLPSSRKIAISAASSARASKTDQASRYFEKIRITQDEEGPSNVGHKEESGIIFESKASAGFDLENKESFNNVDSITSIERMSAFSEKRRTKVSVEFAKNVRDSVTRDSATRDSATRDSATRDSATRDSVTRDSVSMSRKSGVSSHRSVTEH